MSKLQAIAQLETKPFFSKSFNKLTQKDKTDQQTYYNLKEELEKEAKSIKKGEEVVFVWHEKRKATLKERAEAEKKYGKGSFMAGAYTYDDVLMKGVIHKPFFVKKRKRFGETDEIPTVECIVGKIIYPVSPNQVEKTNK